jgi:hypothetical protein
MTDSGGFVVPEVALPLRIDRAEFEDPTLLLGGLGWSLSASCIWRWIMTDGRVLTGESADAADAVRDLVGDELVAVTWSGPARFGVDPRFELRSGGWIDMLSDAAFDTWVLHLPEVTLVGPLPR